MSYDKCSGSKIKANNLAEGSPIRYVNPGDIMLPKGYKIEVFAEGLNTPSCIIFTKAGDLYIADTGYTNGRPNLQKYTKGHFEIVADNFKVPLIGINSYKDDIYVSHRGTITVLKADGSRKDVIDGLPSYGDYSNCRVAFGMDGKMYFGIGTATNSGVVGLDNNWLLEHPFFHDYPGSYIILTGQNFPTKNVLVPQGNETAYTGAFCHYGESNVPNEIRKKETRASGGILRSNPDGTNMELLAWGLRSISYLHFDNSDRLFASNDGYDIRGSRPIANAPDEFVQIVPGKWYGWPDYSGGEPLTLPKFKPEGGRQPEFLLVNHPEVPSKPYAVFPNNSTIIGFDFNYDESFAPYGDAFIAEFGYVAPFTYEALEPPYTGTGHRVSRIDMKTGIVTSFAINKSGFPSFLSNGGGLSRPADIAFGPDGAMYIVDMGVNLEDSPNTFVPNTGVIWKVSRV